VILPKAPLISLEVITSAALIDRFRDVTRTRLRVSLGGDGVAVAVFNLLGRITKKFCIDDSSGKDGSLKDESLVVGGTASLTDFPGLPALARPLPAWRFSARL
jgi:hypothetical protein